MHRARWRPNNLPGICKAPGCETAIGPGDGRMLPRPACLDDSLPKVVLLCISCALATAPDGMVGERFAALREEPPADGYTPSGYQGEGATFLAERWAALLADDKGLGKTAQALLAIPDGQPVIVTCPASCKPGWQDEAAIWRPELHATAINGRATFLRSGGPSPGEVYILNYDILPPRIIKCRCGHPPESHPTDELPDLVAAGKVKASHIANTCIECKCKRYVYAPRPRAEVRAHLNIKPGTILIADEVHHVKHGRSEKTKRFRELARACARVWGLSASPLENSEKELRGVYQSIGIFDAAFQNERRFRDLFKAARETSITPTGPARDEIRERRSWVELGRTAAQVGLELPPLRFEERRVILRPKDLAEVERLMVEAMATKRAWDMVSAGDLEDPTESDEAAEAFNRQRDLLKHTAYADQDIVEAIKQVIELGPKAKIGSEMSTLRKALAMAKMPSVIEAFVREAEDAQTPAVMFSAHKFPVESAASRAGWGEISGRISASRRRKTLARWVAGDLRGLACTIKAAGEGLNLHKVGTGFCALAGFVDWEWNPEKNDQAAKRIYRRGQKLPCLITSFVADHPIDRHVADVLDVKKQLIEAVTITGGL